MVLLNGQLHWSGNLDVMSVLILSKLSLNYTCMHAWLYTHARTHTHTHTHTHTGIYIYIHIYIYTEFALRVQNPDYATVSNINFVSGPLSKRVDILGLPVLRFSLRLF